jgi:ornithine cyclodeaminase/alanine dehydrogenase-like protein (mu-crystallin family)
MSKPRNGNSQSKKRLGDETGTDSQTKVPKTSDFASKKAAKSGDASESAGSWKLGEFKLGFVGAGVMATAMINGFLDKKIVKASNVIASDPSLASLEAQKAVGVSVTTSNADVVAFADVIILAVKVTD